MKALNLFLFLCLMFISTSATYAGDDKLIVNYPATQGTYNRIILNQTTQSVDCTQTNNQGTLYMDPSTNTLQICNSGTNTAIPFHEACFNRFCSATSASPGSCTSFLPPNNPCPTGYSVANINGGTKYDQFQADASVTVYSLVCCYTGATIFPS